jgi:hypothetical protein
VVLLALFVVLWRFPPWLTVPAPPVQHAAQLAGARILDVVAVLQQYLLLVGALSLALALVVLVLWRLPKWQAAGVQEIKDRLTVENAARQTLAQIIGGMVLIAGLFFTWANLNVTQENIKITQDTAAKNLEMTREGQITDRFTKAIAQLGDTEHLAVRLGGIYALERIAKDSKKDYWPIMEVLTAYVRETAPWSPEEAQPVHKLGADIQAILTVLGRRTYIKEEEKPLNLTNINLRGADLTGAHLEQADLRGANLELADIEGAQLEQALLRAAHLEQASLMEAHLEGADLRAAQMGGANLGDAYMEGINLGGAQLEGVIFWGAQLKGARDLTVEQLATVETLYQAQLDPPILGQIQQLHPRLLQKFLK